MILACVSARQSYASIWILYAWRTGDRYRCCCHYCCFRYYHCPSRDVFLTTPWTSDRCAPLDSISSTACHICCPSRSRPCVFVRTSCTGHPNRCCRYISWKTFCACRRMRSHCRSTSLWFSSTSLWKICVVEMGLVCPESANAPCFAQETCPAI